MSHPEHSKIGKRAGIVGSFTFLSRIFGLVRDVVVAYFFGASATADAFYVAFRIPNLFRRLTAEGALTIAFVPIYSDYLKKSREESYKVASIVFTYLSLALVAIVLLGIIFAPYLVKLFAYGFTRTPEKFYLTVYLTRLMFPYVLLISLTALAMGILNSLKHFATPAASPIFLNVFIIIGAAVFSRWFVEPTVGLAIGVIIGGLCQIGLQIPALMKRGMLPRLNFDYRHPALKRLLFLMLPAAFGAAVYQVNVLVVTLLASFLPSGSVSYLWYADRVTEFPLGIFAIAIATATLPSLSEHASSNDLDSLKQTFRYGLTGAFAVTIPASVGLYVLSIPVIRLLFERGVFYPSDTVGVAGALSLFILGMPFVGAVRNIVPAFFAMKDSKTPVAISTVAVVCNAIFAVILMRYLLVKGLALSLAISNAVNFVLLIILLRRKIGILGGGKIFHSVMRIVFAAFVMGATIFVFRSYVVRALFEKGVVMLGMAVILSIFVGIVMYLLTLKFIKAPEYTVFTDLIRRGKGRFRNRG